MKKEKEDSYLCLKNSIGLKNKNSSNQILDIFNSVSNFFAFFC